MSADPYKTLGLEKNATQEEIQKAYRGLAKKLHPDLNPGNRKAEEQFKEVAAAYDLLGDAEKRGRFDRGEIDASGAERPRQRFYRDFAESGASHPYASDAGFADYASADEVLSEIFGRGGRVNLRMRGQDVHYRLALDFLDALNGAKRQVTLPDDGTVLDVTIPPGTRDGQILRLRGKGTPGLGDGPPGDALVAVEVRPHRIFTRDGDDIRLELPISLGEAVLGGKVNVPTPAGTVAVTVPKGANTGTVLRLKGRGAPRPDGGRGDEYVTLKVVLPEKPDPELQKFVAQWQAANAYNPREKLEA
jgi:DnaJ-class molecular chaperone